MKILIADQHAEVSSALHLMLARIPLVTGVDEVSNLVQLLARCAQVCPDLILFDLDLVHPSRSHPQPLLDLLIVLRRLCPCALVVVLSGRFEAEQEALAAGASAFISKTAPPDEVLSAVIRHLNKNFNCSACGGKE